MSYPLLSRSLFPLFLRYRPHTVEGLEHLPISRPYILAPNHIGFIDGPMLGVVMAVRARRKVFFITKQSVWTFFDQLGLREWMGMIPLITHDPSHSLEHAARVVQTGNVVGIFPEGSRNPASELLKPKTGVARLAFRCGVPIVPVGLIMPPGMTTMEAIRNTFNRSLPVAIRFGHPIPVAQRVAESLTRRDLDGLMHEVMSAISQLSGKVYHPIPLS